MKTAIIASLALLSLSAPVMASTTEQFQFKGESAFASFSQFDGCVSTFVNVDGFNNITKSAPGAPTEQKEAFLSYSTFNFCTGVGSFGFGSSKDVNFSIDNQLQSASLTGNITVFDSATAVSKTAAINLNWTGTGEASRGKFQSNFQGAGFRSISRSIGSSRDASATGSIILDGRNIIANLPSFASLNSSSSGSITITKK